MPKRYINRKFKIQIVMFGKKIKQVDEFISSDIATNDRQNLAQNKFNEKLTNLFSEQNAIMYQAFLQILEIIRVQQSEISIINHELLQRDLQQVYNKIPKVVEDKECCKKVRNASKPKKVAKLIEKKTAVKTVIDKSKLSKTNNKSKK